MENYRALLAELELARTSVLCPAPPPRALHTPSSSQRRQPPSPSKPLTTALKQLNGIDTYSEYDALHASTLARLALVPSPRHPWTWRDDVITAVRASGKGDDWERTAMGVLEGRLASETTSDGVRRELSRAGGVPVSAEPLESDECDELLQLLALIRIVLDLRFIELPLLDPAARSLRTTLRLFTSGLLTPSPPPPPPPEAFGEPHPPTSEQFEILSSPVTPGISRCTAFAGTGKTTSLLQFAERINRDHPEMSVLYCCFNTSLQREADAKFYHLPRVRCQTTGSIAFRFLRKRHGAAFEAKFNNSAHSKGHLNANAVVDQLGLQDSKYPSRKTGELRTLKAKALANRIVRSLERFAGTVSPRVEPWHLHRSKRDAAEVPEKDMLYWTSQLWQSISDWDDPDGPLPYCVHVKLALLDPDFRMPEFGVILFDEAQDSNDADLELVVNQASHARVMLVGDEHQAVYGWRGATNRWLGKPADTILRLSHSFRFGCQISNVANSVLTLRNESLPLKGTSETGQVYRPYLSRALPPLDSGTSWTILFRKNSGLVAALLRYALYALPADLTSPLPRVEIKINDTRLEGFFQYYHHAHHLVMGHSHRWPRNEWSPKLGKFKTWDAVEAEAAAREEEEEVGIEDSELVELARMRDTLATPNFGALLSRVEDSILKKPRHGASLVVPDLVLGTTHQVKGLEWEQVALGDDYPDCLELLSGNASPGFVAEEFNLLYVALTRSRSTLVLNQPLFQITLLNWGLHQFSLTSSCSFCMRCSSTSPPYYIQYSTPFPPPPVPSLASPAAAVMEESPSRSRSPSLFPDEDDPMFPICLGCGSLATYDPLRQFAAFWLSRRLDDAKPAPPPPTPGSSFLSNENVEHRRRMAQDAIAFEQCVGQDFWRDQCSSQPVQPVKRELEDLGSSTQEKKPKFEE